MSSSSSLSADALPVYHVPRPYSLDSAQVSGAQGGGSSGGGGMAPSTGGGSSPSQAANALQFSAACQPTDGVGAVVRTDGSASAVTRLKNGQPFPAVGVIIAKSSQTQCTVQTYGLCINVVDSLQPNTRYFVGPNGNLVTGPQAFGSGGYIQLVGFAVASNVLFVAPRGDIMQLAATRDANGNDTTPGPSGDGTNLIYGGILTGTEPPQSSQGRRGDEYLQYASSGEILLWGPKSDELGWGNAGRSLIGTAGNRIYVRQGPPDDSVDPEPGDLWFDTDSTTIYPAYAA